MTMEGACWQMDAGRELFLPEYLRTEEPQTLEGSPKRLKVFVSDHNGTISLSDKETYLRGIRTTLAQVVIKLTVSVRNSIPKNKGPRPQVFKKILSTGFRRPLEKWFRRILGTKTFLEAFPKDSFHQEVNDAVLAVYNEDPVVPFEGVKEGIQSLRNADFLIYIYTQGISDLTKACLAQHNIAMREDLTTPHEYDGIDARPLDKGDKIAELKTTLIDDCGWPGDLIDIYTIGDSTQDIDSFNKVGANSIAVANEHSTSSREELASCSPDHIVSTFKEGALWAIAQTAG